MVDVMWEFFVHALKIKMCDFWMGTGVDISIRCGHSLRST